MKNFIIKVGPGFLVCFIISILAQMIAKVIPNIGAALFAIGIGLFCGNTFLNKPIFSEGTSFSERNLLEYSIVLTGASLLLGDILALGISGILFIAIQMSVTIFCAYLIGRKLGLKKKFCLLMAAGNAVCGSSAIASVSPVIDANDDDKGIAITIVNLTGTILMVLLPIITGILYHHDMLLTSAMIGGTLQSIGQVIASADIVGHEYVATATIFKIIRIVFIVFVALAFSKMNTSEDGKLFEKSTSNSQVKAGIPWFIIGFFIMSILFTLGIIPKPISNIAHTISTQFEIIALAAIGMRVKFSVLKAQGPKAMGYGLCIACCQVLCAACLIFFLF